MDFVTQKEGDILQETLLKEAMNVNCLCDSLD